MLLLLAGVDDEDVVEMLQVDVADVVAAPDPPLPLHIRAPAVLGRSRFLKLSENEPTLTSYFVPFTAATGTS